MKEIWTDVQKEVWQMEEKYLKAALTNDFDLWMTLWHEDFVGWPSQNKGPITKATLRSAEEQFRQPTPGSISTTQEPVSVQIYGDVAITHYIVHKSGQYEGNAVEHYARITHTWLHQGDTWVIIGGMSAPHSK